MVQPKKTRIRVIEDQPFGVYVWRMPDGRFVANDTEDFLSIAAMKGDQRKIDILKDAVKAFKSEFPEIENGRAVFLSGHRQVSDDEYERQKQRAAWGLTPDDHDIGALKDEQEYLKQYGI